MFDVINNAQQPRVDKLQLSALLGLMLIGVAFIYSATRDTVATGALYDQLWFRQIVWYGLGVGVAVAICLIDYRTLSRFSFVVYWLTIVMLILVLIPHVGSVRFGARRWFDLKVFQLQPSEFAKLAFILAQAHFLSRPPEELKLPGNFWKSIGLMMLPFNLHHLGKEAYGLWMLTGSLAIHFSVLDMGYGGALVKFMAQYRAHHNAKALNEIASTLFFDLGGTGAAPAQHPVV